MVNISGRIFKNKKNKQISIVIKKKLIDKEDKKEFEELVKNKKVRLSIFK